MKTDEYFNNLIDAVVRMNKKDLDGLVSKGIAQGIDPLLIVNEGITLGLRKVGDLFADEAIFLPELVLAGQMVTEVMESLKPQLSGDKAFKKKGLFLIATVKGDVHEIGKNLVALLLGASGYDVVDLGKDVATDIIVQKINELAPDIVGLSSLLSTTMPAQKEVVQSIEEAGIREKVKIMVGGAPVTRDWARQIGADGYAEDASTAVDDADRLMGLS